MRSALAAGAWMVFAVLLARCGGEASSGGRCGDGVVDQGVETCDGDCPAICLPATCFSAVLAGSAATCDARCETSPITTCVSNDACCPAGCDNSSDGDCAPTCGDEALAQEMATTLDTAALDPTITTDANFTVMLQANDGRTFVHAHGSSSGSTSYESASTSKLVSATVILTLVDQGYLSFDSRPYDLIDFWTGESSVTLAQLLSFTSGFDREPCSNGQVVCLLSCLNLPNADFETCVHDIYDHNIALPPPAAGSQFHYASTHLQIAGLMALKATGKIAWSSIFAAFQQQTGLLLQSSYALPSADNPRLAGGMFWTAEDYLAFLAALQANRRPTDGQPLLSQSSWDALFANQRGGATVASSPVWERLQEDWAYGFGNWLECPTATTPGSFNCGSGHRNSSPGAYGAYPFIDFDYAYIGIVARQSSGAGSFPEGVAIFRQIEARAREWASFDCP